MQMISLMDSLLKKVNLDLKLRTYAVLATGPTDGTFSGVFSLQILFPCQENFTVNYHPLLPALILHTQELWSL